MNIKMNEISFSLFNISDHSMLLLLPLSSSLYKSMSEKSFHLIFIHTKTFFFLVSCCRYVCLALKSPLSRFTHFSSTTAPQKKKKKKMKKWVKFRVHISVQ